MKLRGPTSVHLLAVPVVAPVEDVPFPPPYEPSLAVGVTGGLAVLAVLAFVLVALGAGRLAPRVLRVAVSALAVMVGAVALFLVVAVREQGAHETAQTEHLRAEVAERTRVVTELEQHFGVELADSRMLALDGAVEGVVIDRGAGEEECLLGAPTGVLEIRCGSEDWDAATPLPAGGTDDG